MPGIWLLPMDAQGQACEAPTLLGDPSTKARVIEALFRKLTKAQSVEVWRGDEQIGRHVRPTSVEIAGDA